MPARGCAHHHALSTTCAVGCRSVTCSAERESCRLALSIRHYTIGAHDAVELAKGADDRAPLEALES